MSKRDKAFYKQLAKDDKARFSKELNELTTLNVEDFSGNKNDITKPKKPLTPYMLFVRETR